MTHPNPSSAPEGVIPPDVRDIATRFAENWPGNVGFFQRRSLIEGAIMADRSSRAEGVGAEQLQKAWHATEARRSDIQGFYRRDDNSHYIRDLGLRRGEDVLWSESGEYEPTHAAMMERIELEQFRIVSASLSAIVPAPVREGWVLVPKEPTPEMIEASAGALRRFIEALPPEAKVKGSFGGYWLAAGFKARLRYQAMIAAAPAQGGTDAKA